MVTSTSHSFLFLSVFPEIVPFMRPICFVTAAFFPILGIVGCGFESDASLAF